MRFSSLIIHLCSFEMKIFNTTTHFVSIFNEIAVKGTIYANMNLTQTSDQIIIH